MSEQNEMPVLVTYAFDYDKRDAYLEVLRTHGTVKYHDDGYAIRSDVANSTAIDHKAVKLYEKLKAR